MLIEANIDGLVGPTHHYGGLGIGNLASQTHAGQLSNPRGAALEGLHKAMLAAELGVPQFLWLPPKRPRLDFLEQLGFAPEGGNRLSAAAWQAALRQAAEESPAALSAAYGSAFMWTANAGTFTPATDSSDGTTHFTPANLISNWHRGLETAERGADFAHLFERVPDSLVHPALPPILPLRDEGAANHMRLCDRSGHLGVHIFVYGESGNGKSTRSSLFPRQTQAASQALARQHRLPPARTFFLQQHPDAISAGVFHNDVIATSHYHLMIHHELAFVDSERQMDRLERVFRGLTGESLQRVVVPRTELSLEQAVASYFFNSQILTPVTSNRGDAPRMVLICPSQCQSLPAARRLVERLVTDPSIPVDDVRYVTLQQSMANGGGPACLRLRLPIDEATLPRLNQRYRLTAELADRLTEFFEQHYPTRVSLEDLAQPEFLEQVWHVADNLRCQVRT